MRNCWRVSCGRKTGMFSNGQFPFNLMFEFGPEVELRENVQTTTSRGQDSRRSFNPITNGWHSGISGSLEWHTKQYLMDRIKMATSPLFTPDFHIPACQHQEPLNTLEKIPDFLSARFSPPSILGDYADKLEDPSRRDVCLTIFIPEFFSSGKWEQAGIHRSWNI